MESLNIALASLKKDFQEIITLRFIEGYSVKETAQLVKKTEVFVRVLQHRAIKELRTKLI